MELDFVVKQIEEELDDPTNMQAFIEALARNKEKFGISWTDVSVIVETQFGFSRGRDYYRRNYGEFAECASSGKSIEDKLFQMNMLKTKISDERIQNNAILRRLSREESIKEIALEAADRVASQKPFLEVAREPINYRENLEGILCLSDWHYGIEIDSFLNKYDVDSAKKRVSDLLETVIDICISEGIKTLHVLNLGDLICGRIHLTLRLQSRIDVMTQILDVSEILCEFLDQIMQSGITVHYYDCLDNHSRIEPDKTASLDLESLCRFIPEYIKCRFRERDNITVHDNEYGPDIISFTCMGHKILGLHGHQDRLSDILDDVKLLTHESFDLACVAHFHHFSGDEKNESIVLGNGTLMGTDQYAEKKWLSSKPSQNFIVVSSRNVVEDIKRILV